MGASDHARALTSTRCRVSSASLPTSPSGTDSSAARACDQRTPITRTRPPGLHRRQQLEGVRAELVDLGEVDQYRGPGDTAGDEVPELRGADPSGRPVGVGRCVRIVHGCLMMNVVHMLATEIK